MAVTAHGKGVRRGAGGRPRRPGVTEAILDATIALAAEGNLAELTLDAIAERAEVGRPTIYRRWPSKESLLEEAVTKMVNDHQHFPETGNVRDDLVAHARRLIEGVQSPLRDVYVAYFNVGESGLAEEAFNQARDRIQEVVRRAVARGELRPDTDPNLLLELIFGVIWYRANTIHRHMERSFAETVVDAVLNSWLAEPAPRKEARPPRRRPASR